MENTKALISPYLLKDFIYEEAIPQNEVINALIAVLGMSKSKATQVLSLIQDEVKEVIKSIYIGFIEAHPSLNVSKDTSLTNEVVDYFYIRLHKELTSFFNNLQENQK